LIKGGDYVEIPDGGMKKRFEGIIDLTNYYVVSRQKQFFPGQRGFWVHKWVGFEGDDPQYRNPREEHGINWLGFIFENHGPFKVSVTIHRLNAYEKAYDSS
jgi:hypothetical protein